MTTRPYGREMILDVKTTGERVDRETIATFFEVLCVSIDMVAEDMHFWDYEGDPDAYAAAPDHVRGTSAIQFIRTSNITVHTLDALGMVYINVFSCKHFNPRIAEDVALSFFPGRVIARTVVDRCLA